MQEAGLTAQWAAFIDMGTSKAGLAEAVKLPYKVKGEIMASELGNQAYVFKRPMGVMYVVLSPVLNYGRR